MGETSQLSVVKYHFGALRSKADAWADLPAPPETFQFQDVPEFVRPEFCRLRETDAVQHVEQTRHEDRGGDIWSYRWHPEAWAIIQEVQDDRYSPCPCGHGGLRNCGDHFECCYDGCDREFDRSEVTP